MYKTKKYQRSAKRNYKKKTPLYVTPYRRPNNSPTSDWCNVMQLKEYQKHTSSSIGIVNQRIWVHSPYNCTDWASCLGLYDLYKVLACKVEIFPAQTYAELAGGTAIYPVMWSYDPDSATAITSMSAAVQYNNLKAIPVTSRGTYYVKPGVAYTGSTISANQGVTIEYRGERWLNVLYASSNLNGIIQWYGEDMPVSQPMFNLVITYTVKFCSRR